MSNWIGSGSPVFIIQNDDLTQSTYTYPHTIADGRSEVWEPEVQLSWVNISGERIEDGEELRFVGTYTWRGLTNDQVRQLVRWKNQRQRFTFRPHSDVNVYQFLCSITDLQTPKGPVVTSQDIVTARIEAVSRVTSRPIPDTRIYGFYHPLKGVV